MYVYALLCLSRFEELKEVSTETAEKKALALIKRTQQLISLG